MFRKKLIAAGLVSAMLCSLVACGDKGNTDPDKGASAGTATKAPAPNHNEKEKEEAASGIKDHSGVDAGSIVNFEDGNYAFAKYNEADWSGSKGATLSVADKLDGKALCVNRTSAGNPAVAVDLASLLGDNASKCAKVSVDIGVDPTNGVFNAVSGSAVVYAGEANTECKSTFAIYKATAAMKTVEIDLGTNGIDPAATNYLTIIDLDDSSSTPTLVYLDNIICYDASGSALPLNSGVEFAVEGVGEYDWSNATSQPENEVLLYAGANTGTSWWPEAANSFVFDEANTGNGNYIKDFTFGPGDVITIYYRVADPEIDVTTTDKQFQCFPYFRIQNWQTTLEDGSKVDDPEWPSGTILDVSWTDWKDGMTTDASRAFYYDNGAGAAVGLDEDNTPAETVMINDSYTIVQYPYEFFTDCATVNAGIFAEDGMDVNQIFKFADFCGVADRGLLLKIDAVTVGKATNQ